MKNTKIQLESISKAFIVDGKKKLVLDRISLDVKEGEFVSIVGPSGCGKTTLLNIIAGLEEQDKGNIKINQSSVIPDPIGNLDSRFRGNDKWSRNDKVDRGYKSGNPSVGKFGKVGYMQQKDLLFPWRSVLDNAILGLEIKGMSRGKARQKALSLIDAFGLKGFENQYPSVLSGGMRQRLAFLRTMLLDQDIMLLDEPFGALDKFTRTKMQKWLENLWQRFNKTIILVTHDIEEAILLSDRIYVLSARPTKVTRVLNVSLPRPRTYKMITESDFVRIKKNLLDSLHREI